MSICFVQYSNLNPVNKNTITGKDRPDLCKGFNRSDIFNKDHEGEMLSRQIKAVHQFEC